MNQRPAVVLIVDNPLRDLDGLALVAWHLARRGFDAWLTPMYDQAFVVKALRPAVVVTNYLRPNNLEHLREYKRRGARVVVIDTEGAVGQSSADLAKQVIHNGGVGLADAYCVWGDGQHRSFLEMGVTSPERLYLTGCPRYDFAALPWRNALPETDISPGFVLINTNFPSVNPRFSAGRQAEREAMLSVGVDPDYIEQRFIDDQAGIDGMVALTGLLADRFPEQTFVLRPHPFEDPDYYAALTVRPNVQVRQQGTSIEWLNGASLMVHLSCSTAVEAVMLGLEPLSPLWLEKPSLRVPGPAAVSRQLQTAEAMSDMVAAVTEGRQPPLDPAVAAARASTVRECYGHIDGRAAERIAEAVQQSLQAPLIAAAPPRLRSRITTAIATMMGAGPWLMARQMLNPAVRKRYAAKQLKPADVASIIERISAAAGHSPPAVERGGRRGLRSAVKISVVT